MSDSGRKGWIRRWRSYLLRTVLFTVLAALALIVYLNFFALPQPLLVSLLSAVSKGPVAVEADGIRLQGLTTVRISGPALYAKHCLGKPFFKSDEVDVVLDPAAWLAGRLAVKTIRVSGAEVRPLQLKVSSKDSAGAGFAKGGSFSLELADCQLYDLNIVRLRTPVVIDRASLNLTAIDAELAGNGLTGRASGKLSLDLEQKRVDIDLVSNMEPSPLFAVFKAYKGPFLVKLLKRLDFFGSPPRVKWMITMGFGAAPYQRVVGEFRLRDTSYRGVFFSRADGMFTVVHSAEELTAKVDRLFLVNTNGMANVSLVAKPRLKQLTFKAESTLPIYDTACMVGVMTNLLATEVLFEGPSTLTAHGLFDLKPARRGSDISAEIKADDVSVFGFRCDSGYAALHMLGRQVVLTNMAANAYDGFVNGSVQAELPMQKDIGRGVACRMNIRISNADFDSLMKSLQRGRVGGERHYEGLFGGIFDISFVTGKDMYKSINGRISVRIKDGRVFMLPIFGGLSDFMVKVVPGLGFILSQNDAIFDFRVKDGLMTADKLKIEGDVLSLKGKGSYQLGDQLDFYVQVKLLKGKTFGGKIFRALTYPLSKLFEFKVHGTVGAPKWYPVNFSLDIFRRSKHGVEDL